ncbi:MAG: glycosyltransferase family 9 protein [Bacteroidota bacterium]|nr:glycosyltransferase family 9 protein [Bacteroidota bacterium]
MERPVLIIQTAFAGDMILTLPLVQEARRLLGDGGVDVLCIPATEPLLRGHPAVRSVITYDKHGSGRMAGIIRRLRATRYGVVLCPHRSFRSAVLSVSSGATVRVGFDRSAGAALFTERVPYREGVHEVERNLDLLARLTGGVDMATRPCLRISEADEREARNVRASFGDEPYVCIAPGSVWPTKRWMPAGFATVARELAREYAVVFVGGKEDTLLCREIAGLVDVGRCVDASGALGFPASAALIAGARLLIANDSAPVHLASAMGTPVVAVFGATIPAFGFTPFGVPHEIIEVRGLACRPCGRHGGKTCPVGTFVCMREITPDRVYAAAVRLLEAGRRRGI